MDESAVSVVRAVRRGEYEHLVIRKTEFTMFPA